MAQLTGQNDEQFAAGAAVGGAITLAAGKATTIAVAAKVGTFAALGTAKTGMLVAAVSNPFLAGAVLLGGAGYLIYKVCKK